jgi:hypothetical protein
MLMIRSWLVILSIAVAACQGAPAPRGQAPAGSVKGTPALAAEALERGEYAKAADLYRIALATAPDSLPLHFGLGVSDSYVDRKAEAVRELVWVLEHGEPGSHEVRAARLWLRSVGALPSPESGETAAAQEEPAAEQHKGPVATLHGRAVSGDTSNDVAPQQRMQLFLIQHPSRVNYFRIRTDEQGHFRFDKVPPGIYKLTDRIAGPPVWRLQVELKPGQDLNLDLGPANSTRVRDDFPEAAPADWSTRSADRVEEESSIVWKPERPRVFA